MNKAERGVRTLQVTSFQNLLGISFQNLLGRMIQLSWGIFGLHWGMVPLDVCIPPGNNLILRLSGMLAEEHLYTPLGNVLVGEITLRGITLWEEILR